MGFLRVMRLPDHEVLLYGLVGPTEYNGFSPFLNWYKSAQEPTITRSAGGSLTGKAIWDAGTYLDTATGDFLSSVPSGTLTLRTTFWVRVRRDEQVAAGCDYTGEKFIAEWDGSATASWAGGGTGAVDANINSNKQSIVFGSSPDICILILTLTDINDPPRNIRIYQDRYASNVANGERFNPDWLAVIQKAGELRFMDWSYVNRCDITDFSQLADVNYYRWCKRFGTGDQSPVQDYGPKGGIHPQLACEVANLTGCKIWVNLPVKCTDSFITAFATYFRDNTTVQVTFEYSNECFHTGFPQIQYCADQGDILFAGDGNDRTYHAWKWYGYRSSQMMAIIRGIYNNAARWRGVLCGQAVNSYTMEVMLDGFDSWKTETGSSLNFNDLFGDLSFAPYFCNFNSILTGVPISGITNDNPAVVTTYNNHGYTTGQRKKLFTRNGMTQINDIYATITVTGAKTFSLDGIDSTSYDPYVDTGDDNTFACSAAMFELMDESNSRFVSSPGTYPTKYTYFNQQIKIAGLTGSCDQPGVVADTYLANYVDVHWPAYQLLATARGVGLCHYEGGNHLLGDGYLSGYLGIPQLTEYMVANGHSQEMADVYDAVYTAAFAAGHKRPAKFVEAGPTTEFGTFPGIRYWPLVANGDTTDIDNPVWNVVKEWYV